MAQPISPMVQRELDACPLPWRIEAGGRHRKLYVAGRFITILPYGRAKEADRMNLNVCAHIRRAVRAAQGER